MAKQTTQGEATGGRQRLRDAIIQKVRGAGTGPPEAPPPRRRRKPAERRESLWDQRIALFGPRLRDMAMFCRQLSTLLDVGVPLLRCLKVLSSRTQHPRLKRVVREVADEVERGNRFSAALAQHPRIFSPLFVNVVRVGETGGILETSVRRLTEILESKASIRRRVRAASAYPVAVLTVAAAVVVLILVFAIPKFQEIYKQMNAELRGPIQWISQASEFLRNYYWLVILIAVALLGVFYLFRRSATGKRVLDFLRLQLPGAAAITVQVAIARTTRTLGSLLAAGIPLLEALQITAESSENTQVADALFRARDAVENGGKLEDQLRREARVFPPIVVDMIAIGEEAGALDVVLLKLANTYDEEVDATLRSLTAVIEPVLIVLLGLLVIFLALSVLLPYFELVQNLE